MSVSVLDMEMWVVPENGSSSAAVLSVLRGNVGLVGEVSTHLKVLINCQVTTS